MKRKLIWYHLSQLLDVLIVVLALITGYTKTGWITNDFAPTIALLGLFYGLYNIVNWKERKNQKGGLKRNE